MLYSDLCSTYDRIENLSKRLDMTDELIRMYSVTPPNLIETVVRLTKGEIRPGYEGFELGVAEKLAMKAIYLVTMIPLKEIEEERIKCGDIGSAAEILVSRKKQTTLFHEPLTVERVFKNLEKIATSEGKASQDLKLKLVADILHDATPIEARYFIRTVCQKMRLGTADMTQIDALAYLYSQDMDMLSTELKNLGIPELGPMIEGIEQHLVGSLNELNGTQASLLEVGLEKEKAKVIKDKIKELKTSIQMNREKIVKAFNIHPDLGSLAQVLSDKGIGSIDEIRIEPGIPLRSMLGERLPSIAQIIEKMEGKVAFEYKYDGLRVQAHIRNGGASIDLFSRQLENITEQFPDVVMSIKKDFIGTDAIIEGECVPIDKENGGMLPFQVISQRRGRIYDLREKIDEIPVDLVIFDCLYQNGSEMIDSPYLKRREVLQGLFRDLPDNIVSGKGLSLSRMEIIEDPSRGEEFFETALREGCEGIMAKSTSDRSLYQAGNRGWMWVKYKRDYQSEMVDTMDLVVVGAYHGAGRRGGTYGALLMSVYDPANDMFRTICKLGSGFNDEHLERLPGMLSDLRTGGDPGHNVDTRMTADIYFDPFVVLEVKGAEITFSPIHTCAWNELKNDAGLAVRFPRFTGRFREDKGPTDATTVEEIRSMYEQQVKTI